MPATVPLLSTDTLTIRPWPDPVIDALGHDPRSRYVETFWLGILGPSTTLLLRLVADEFERNPAGFELPLEFTAHRLGLGHKGGRHSPFVRALTRLVQFDLAQPRGDGELAVRRRVPPLSRRQIVRLTDGLQRAHEEWQQAEANVPKVETVRRRSRQLALSLFELGEDREAVERQLVRWRFHPAMSHESAAWAWDRHRQAATADVATDLTEAGTAPSGGDAA